MRLRVVRDGGRPLTLQDSITRNLLRIVDMLPASFVVGLGSMLLSPDGKRLGDLAAGAIVIRLERPPAPPMLPQLTDEATAFRFDRAQVMRIGPLDRQRILETRRRHETLKAEQAGALLARTVEVIRQRIGYGDVSVGEQRAFLLALLSAAGGA
jgi:hypothetical protein